MWHVRDHGRGLRYQHLTQNESEEKRASDVVVGQFGVGLKDALATFHRNGIGVRISSPHGTIGLTEQSKHGFGDVVTLHAIVDAPADIDGTDVALTGIADADVAEAMGFFLVFDATVEVLETTPAGQVLARPGDAPRSVYVRGVRVAEDDGLLFSYNVTKVDAKLRRALNRERSNVGRSAYTDRIKAILLAVETPHVLTRLVDDMAGFAKGATRDEVKWNDIAERVVRQLAVSDPDTVFVTAAQRWSHPELIRRAEIDGKHVFVIPDALAARLRAADDDTVTTLERFAAEWNDRVVIEPIDPAHLEAARADGARPGRRRAGHRRPASRRVGRGGVRDVAPDPGRHRDGARPVGTGAAPHRHPPLMPRLGASCSWPPCCTRSATPSPAPPTSPPSSKTASPTSSAPSAPTPSPPADGSRRWRSHIGTSGWSYDHWDGVLYPHGTPSP